MQFKNKTKQNSGGFQTNPRIKTNSTDEFNLFLQYKFPNFCFNKTWKNNWLNKSTLNHTTNPFLIGINYSTYQKDDKIFPNYVSIYTIPVKYKK